MSSEIVPPSLDDGVAVFLGNGPAGRYGLYRWENGRISTVADTTTPIPGRTDRITSFFSGPPVVSGANIAFTAITNDPGTSSLFVSRNGTLSRVAGPDTAAPDGLGTITALAVPTISGDRVWFYGSYRAPGTNLRTGIFEFSNDRLSTVIHSDLPVPGHPGMHFESFSGPHADHGELAFFGSGLDAGVTTSTAGIYRTSGGAILTVADSSTTFPDDPGHRNLPEGSGVSHDGRNTAFTASQFPGTDYGLWVERDGVLKRIAFDGEPTPDGKGVFKLTPPIIITSLDNGHLAFSAETSAGQPENPAIFTDLGGSLTRLVGAGDRLTGKTVSEVQISPDALSGNSIAFAAIFTDGSSGIFLATLPDPNAVSLLGLAGLTCLRRRRSRLPRA